MPTALPSRPPQVRRLSWPETIRFLALVARVRWLDMRLHAAGRFARHDSSDRAGDRLLSLARRWLTLHEAIGALLGIPEPPHVAIVRVTLNAPQSPTRQAAPETHGL